MYTMQELPSPDGTKQKGSLAKSVTLKQPRKSPQRQSKFSLMHVVDDSCSFFEQMEKKNEGSLEKMLVNIRDKVEKSKVNIDKREQYDP